MTGPIRIKPRDFRKMQAKALEKWPVLVDGRVVGYAATARGAQRVIKKSTGKSIEAYPRTLRIDMHECSLHVDNDRVYEYPRTWVEVFVGEEKKS